jgi:hypothetical protein
MNISFNARKEFAQIAEAAGTSIEVLLKQAANTATTEGENAIADIEHDEQVVQSAKLRIKRSQIALKRATNILKTVRRYVS